MLSRIQDLFTRHRKKFIITGIVVGGTFIAIKYAQRKLLEFHEKQAREFFEKTRRLQHFESTERTCNQVIIGMSNELCQEILRECSTEELLQQLRQNPPNKVELWEEMKIVAFTRLTTFIYATSMLVIALRVQMNLLGGYLYRDITTEEERMNDNVKQQYLALIRYFVHEGGLRDLVKIIKSKVVESMKSMPLAKKLTLSDLEQLFWSLQMAINCDKGDPNLKMAKYLMPPQVPEYSTNEPLLQKMYNETLDLLETSDASIICSNNICRGFTLSIDAIAENLGETILLPPSDDRNRSVKIFGGKNAVSGDVKSHNNNTMMNINNVQIPLAKMIPIVSGLTSKGFDTLTRPQNLATSLVTFYVVAEKCKVLGANIYESFSSAASPAV